MSVVWWVLLAYVVGVVLSVRPLAKNEALNYGYYCCEERRPVREPCLTPRRPYGYWSHDKCSVRDPRTIGAVAIRASLVWPIPLAFWSARMTWDGLTRLVGSVPETSKVDERHVAELERELGLGDE